MTRAELLAAIDRTAEALPGVLATWASLDADLREHHVDELVALLTAARDALVPGPEMLTVDLEPDEVAL